MKPIEQQGIVGMSDDLRRWHLIGETPMKPLSVMELNLIQQLEDMQFEMEDLKTELTNMTLEKDIQYDRAERLEEAVNDLENGQEVTLEGYEHLTAIDEDRLEQYEKSEELLDEIKDRISELNNSYVRLDLGVLSEIDNIIKGTNELLEVIV